MQNKAQGAIEYLLIIGAAILVVAIVIIGINGLLGEGKKNTDINEISVTNDPLKEDLAGSMNEYYIPKGQTNYFEYTGNGTSIGDLAAGGNGVTLCLGNDCGGTTPVNNGNVITVTSGGGSGTIPKKDLNKQEPPLQEICTDLIDNDKDAKIDCADLDCNATSGCEYGNELTCGDEKDNDGDEQTDCFDSECINKIPCEIEAELTCNDGLDNDADGLKDCQDSDCYLQKNCALFFDDFENGLNGWMIVNDGGDGTTWDLYTQSSGKGIMANFGNGPEIIDLPKSITFPSTFLGVGERCKHFGSLAMDYFFETTSYKCSDEWIEKSYAEGSSPIILPSNQTIVIEFDSWTDNENASNWPDNYYDVEYIEVSNDGGTSWNYVEGQPIPELQEIYADATLRHFKMDLSPYSGQTILLRFRYDTGDDCCGAGEGWYIDNVWIHKEVA